MASLDFQNIEQVHSWTEDLKTDCSNCIYLLKIRLTRIRFMSFVALDYVWNCLMSPQSGVE